MKYVLFVFLLVLFEVSLLMLGKRKYILFIVYDYKLFSIMALHFNFIAPRVILLLLACTYTYAHNKKE